MAVTISKKAEGKPAASGKKPDLRVASSGKTKFRVELASLTTYVHPDGTVYYGGKVYPVDAHKRDELFGLTDRNGVPRFIDSDERERREKLVQARRRKQLASEGLKEAGAEDEAENEEVSAEEIDTANTRTRGRGRGRAVAV